MKNHKYIDLNTILQFLNILFLLILWVLYYVKGDTLYTNKFTILLGTILIGEIHLFLIFERRKRDVFILLLCLQMVLYFILRIITLLAFEFSFVFLRYAFNPSDLNYALIFMIFANLAIFLGLKLNSIKSIDKISHSLSKPNKVYLVLILLFIGFALAFSESLGLEGLNRILGMIKSLFVNLSIIIFMVIVYLMLFGKSIGRKYFIVITFCLFLFILFQTLTGSRSAILTIVNFVIFSSLSIFNYVKIRRIYFIFFTLFLPIMFVLFMLATFLRPRLEDRAVVGIQTFEVIKEFDIVATLQDNSNMIFGEVFDRVGFLDYGSEIISNSSKYSTIFNMKFYTFSIIDNVLTPGFDLFDSPRASNSVRFIYNKEGTPAKSKVGEGYQSDEFTIYGEYYALFWGWFSLIPIFFTAFLIKRYYVKIKANNIYEFYLQRAFVIYVYYSLLSSFGIDWILLDAMSIFFTYKIFKYFFKINTLKSISIS